MRLVGTTKSTIESIRERTHWNAANLQPMDPVTLGLCSQIDLDLEVHRAAKEKPIDHDRAGRDAAARLRDHDPAARAGAGGGEEAERRAQRRCRVRQAQANRRRQVVRRLIRRRSPFVPAQQRVKLLQLSLARNQPLSSPRRRGPIATELSISRRPHHVATTRRMGPRLRGDDSGRFIDSHILGRNERSMRHDFKKISSQTYSIGPRAVPAIAAR